MNRTILPLKRRGDRLAIRRESESPMMEIQNEMNRMFDQFFADPFTVLPLSVNRYAAEFSPKVDVTETATELKISAELPGMDEKDINISLEQDSLILSGEKKTEIEEKEKNYHRIERSYGSFQRIIPLNCEVEEEKVEATFKNGVLTITLPKPAGSSKEGRKINIKSG